MANRDQVSRGKSRWNNPDGTRMQCFKPGCPAPVKTQGLCQYHYGHFYYESTRGATKARKNRNLSKPGGLGEVSCTFEGCNNPEFNPGLCAGHYYQNLKGGEMRPLRAKKVCPVPGCDQEYADRKGSRGLCSTHSGTCSRFGISPERLVKMYEDYSCSNPGCGSSENLGIDHDHSCCPRPGRSCGKCVRGWLCSGCNQSLGLLQESEDRILGLVKYLKSNR